MQLSESRHDGERRRIIPRKSLDGGVRLAGGPLYMPHEGESSEESYVPSRSVVPLPSYGVKF